MRSNVYYTERERWFVWHVILFAEPNPTGSRPRDLIGLYKQQTKPTPPTHKKGKGRSSHRRKSGQNGAKVSQRKPWKRKRPRKPGRKERGKRKTKRKRPRKRKERKRKEKRTHVKTQTTQRKRGEGWRNSRGSAAARPILTRDWGGCIENAARGTNAGHDEGSDDEGILGLMMMLFITISARD